MDKVYTQDEVAERYHLEPLTLTTWRHRGTGPKWFRAGKRAMYREAALAEWEAEREDEQTAKRAS